MAVKLWEAPTQVFKSTLDGRLDSSSVTIPLISSVDLVAPGIVLINRQDGQGNNTHNIMEYCSFTAISGNTLTGVTRGLGGSLVRSHNSGSLVECFPSVTHWGDLLDFVRVEHDGITGTVSVLSHVNSLTFTGVSGVTGIKGDVVLVPGSNISIYAVSGVSGYSYLKFDLLGGSGGGLPPFQINGGVVSLANQTPLLINEEVGTIKSISAVLRDPVSGASLVIDINKNFTSLFTDQNTRISILGAGTYASTASVGTKTLVPGDLLSIDVDNTSTGVGTASYLTVLVET